MTKASSLLWRKTLKRKLVEASCSNFRRSRMLLEVSSSMPMRKGEIGLPAEIANFLRGFVVKNFEVVFFEVGDEFVAAIEHGEEDVHEVDAALDDGGILAGRWSVRAVGRLNGRRRSLRGRRRRLLRAIFWREGQAGKYRQSRNQN